MTYEEALDWLIHKISIDVQNSRDIPKDIECLEMCEKALEKQLPRKPVYRTVKKYKNIFDGSEVEVYELESCPACGWYPLEVKYTPLHSCPKCNQRIDWGKE